jgi:allantoinase
MSQVNDDYLRYGMRRYGYDHNWYDWSLLGQRVPVNWPDRKPLALWFNVSLQQFPLNQQGKPFKVPFGMTMPYPDLRHFSLRDYGNRVGIYRFLKLFEANQLPVTYAINASLAKLAPQLIQRISQSAAEIIGHGWDMDHLHWGDMPQQDERELIERSIKELEQATGHRIEGWLSPARSQSWHTLRLLAQSGVRYCLDWVNDDMPYRLKGDAGELTMLPLNAEVEDSFVMGSNLHSEDEWVDQVTDAVDFLIQEARQLDAGRILGISLHPWLTGQPHRIGCLERVVTHIKSRQSEIWLSSPNKIISHFKQAQQ